MTEQVLINETSIQAEDFYEETMTDKQTGEDLHKIGFHFKVTSEDYHDITTLLYKNDFYVKVPGKNMAFQATIYTYSTSITNLYEENAIGDFSLELIEKG